MASVRTYVLIYVALLALATGKFVFFEFDQYFTYWMAMGGTMILAVMKTSLIVGYFQHLIDEPRSLTYLMLSALFGVVLLIMAAGFSIQ